MYYNNLDNQIRLKLLDVFDTEKLFDIVERYKDDLSTFIPWFKTIHNLESVKRHIKYGIDLYKEGYGFQIGIWENDNLIGFVGTDKLNLNNYSIGIGCYLIPEFQNLGIMKMVGLSILDLLFVKMAVNKVEVRTSVINVKSIKLIENLRFKKEGEIRAAEVQNGVFINHLIFSLLKNEWNNNIKKQKL